MKRLIFMFLVLLAIGGCSSFDEKIWNGGYCDACNKEHWGYDHNLLLLYCPRCGYYHAEVDWVDTVMINRVIRREERVRIIRETIRMRIEENKR